MTKVKVFVYRRRQQQRRQQQQRRGYDNSSPDFRHGELKNEECMCRLRNITLESVTEKCDRRTTDKVIPMCRYASQATQK